VQSGYPGFADDCRRERFSQAAEVFIPYRLICWVGHKYSSQNDVIQQLCSLRAFRTIGSDAALLVVERMSQLFLLLEAP
jgi:hypothetical protein